MRVEFTRAARRDVLDARAWYEDKVGGLGAEFDEVVVLACFHHRRDPGDWPQG